MYKQSPSRNYRSKGIKVKHILQICLLLAVCFWLIYQVKHSHEKKREFDEKGAEIRPETESIGGIKFGRKDLSRVEKVNTEEKTHEDDEEGNEVEEEENKQEIDEDKHEEEEHGSEDDRIEENEEEEDQGRGGGDDEIDENELEKAEAEGESEQAEEIIDEEKEREEETDEKSEENEEDGTEDHAVEENESEAHDHDGESRNAHEAREEHYKAKDHAGEENESEARDHVGAGRNSHESREEHYKADDASSEVTHDTPTIIPETGNMTIEHGNYELKQYTSRQENTDNKSGLEVKAEVGEGRSSLNAISVEEKKLETDLNRTDERSVQNSTVPIVFIDKPEDGKNATVVLLSTEHSLHYGSNGTQMTSVVRNMTINGTSSDASSNSQVNILEIDGASDKSQLEDTLTNSNNNTDGANTSSIVSLHAFDDTNLIKSEKLGGSNATGERVDNSGNTLRDNRNHEKHSENNEAEESSGNHSTNENDGDSHDRIGASDSRLTQEVKESQTDLGALPEITTKAHATEEAAGE